MRRVLPALVGALALCSCSWRGLAYEQHRTDVAAAAADTGDLRLLQADRGLCSAQDAACLGLVGARSGRAVVVPAPAQDVVRLVSADAGLAPDSVRLDLARVGVSGDGGRLMLRSEFVVPVQGAVPGPAVAGRPGTLGTVGDDPVLGWTATDGTDWQAWFAPRTTPDVVAAVAGALTEQPAVPVTPGVGSPVTRCDAGCPPWRAGWLAPLTATSDGALAGAQGSLPAVLVLAGGHLLQGDQTTSGSAVGPVTLDAEVGAGPDVDVTVTGADEAIAYPLGPEQVVLLRTGKVVVRVAVAGGTVADAAARASLLSLRAQG